MQSVQELESNLLAYRENLGEVTKLLALDRSNPELIEAAQELCEVIDLTEELLTAAKAEEEAIFAGAGAGAGGVGFGGEPPTPHIDAPGSSFLERSVYDDYVQIDDRLPPSSYQSTKNQFTISAGFENEQRLIDRSRQQQDDDGPSSSQNAMAATPPSSLSSIATYVGGGLQVGMRVQAIWSEDGEWYEAQIEDITPLGYKVVYVHFGNREEVDFSKVKPISEYLEDRDSSKLQQGEVGGGGGEEEEENVDDVDSIAQAEREAEEGRQALKRKIEAAADVDDMPCDIPARLRINPDDSEEVKATKRKKVHAFKSRVRLERLELTQNKRQNAWQQFQTAKGKQKKVGFFTGRKRESIFKSPKDVKGKVGVTNSGHIMTEFARREKHLHLRVGPDNLED